MEEIIALLQRRPASSMKTAGDALPTDTLPVLACSRKMERAAFAMQWGYTVAGGGRVINARSETAAQKPLFQDGIKNRRCLIPAAWYYEWERRGREKVRYAIRPQGKGPAFLAGLYRVDAASGAAQFVVLTREAVGELALIHPRMPVILPTQAHAEWLNPRTDAQGLLREAITQLNFGAA